MNLIVSSGSRVRFVHYFRGWVLIRLWASDLLVKPNLDSRLLKAYRSNFTPNKKIISRIFIYGEESSFLW